MKQNINIEAEGNELILKNKAGDYVIVPKKYRLEVQDMIKDGCHGCIDKLVETLPLMVDYAQNGSVYPTDDKGNPTRKETFTQWGERIKKLAPNLDYIKDDGTYNYRGAYEGGLEPEFVKEDNSYHLGSRNPITGEILKSEKHPSFKVSVEEDMKRGYETYRGTDGKIYSHDKNYLDKNKDKVKEYLGIYEGGILPEVKITAEAPTYIKYKQAWGKENPFDIDKYVAVQDNTYVAPKVVMPLKQKKKQQFVPRERPVLRADNRTDRERKIAQEYTESVLNPSIRTQIGETLQTPLRWATNPFKGVGDIIYAFAPNSALAKDLPNTHAETFEHRRKQLNPYTSNKEKIINTINEAVPLTNWASLNILPVEVAAGNMIKSGIKSGKNLIKPVSKVVGKTDNVTKVGSKVLNKTDDVVKPIVSSVNNVDGKLIQLPKAPRSIWQMKEMPGLHLKSTMSTNPKGLHTQASKDGKIHVENALKFIGKESGGKEKVEIIKKALGNDVPQKMDYNEFRKVVQDQLIPLEKQFATHSSDYGINRLGYYNTDDAYSIGKTWEQARYTRPIENKTLISSNKYKFGRGSSAHGNPEETLGHIHFLRDAETPDVLTVTQIQSDAFQGTHRIMPKTFDKEKQLRSLASMEDIARRQKDMVKNAKKLDANTWQLPDGSKVDKSVIESMIKGQDEINLMKKAEIENFTQKQLLDKNHQERYLQELVDYAGKRGDVNKVRVPTSETAAKVQGYSMNYQELKKISGYADETIIESVKLKEKGLSPEDAFNVMIKKYNTKPSADDWSRFKEFYNKDLKMSYSSEHSTILKKYSEQPKTIKKLFGQEPKIVTDSKGNTWYEFDIPKKFKEGKGEIKAFTVTGAIGTGVGIQSQNKNKE